MKLTFYLFEETVTDFEDALLPGKLEGDSAFEEIPLRDDVPFEARAYLQRAHATPPKWFAFFRPYLEIDDPDKLLNVHNSLLLLLRVDGRVFAVSQGYAFIAINRQRVERNFGLKTTLNAIDPEKIRCLDVRNIDLVTRQKRTQVNYESGLGNFELDLDQDLIRFVSGQPGSKQTGKRMQGSDSLS